MANIKIDAKDTLGNYSVNKNASVMRVGAETLVEPPEGQKWTREEIEEIADERIEAAGVVTKDNIGTYVAQYVEVHKDELKGDTGPAGPKGDAGPAGTKGDAGYTPQRGVDYWTSSDVAAINNYIDSQIGGALNGSY